MASFTFLMVKPDAVGRRWLLSSTEMVAPEDGGDEEEREVVRTLADDKLDVVRKRLAQADLVVVEERRQVLSVAQATAFLAGPEKRTPSDDEVAFLASGPVVCMVLESSREDGDAVDDLNALLGPSNPEDARAEDEKKDSSKDNGGEDDGGDEAALATWTLRGCLGTDSTRNACHGSASSYHASWERDMFFLRPLLGSER